MNTANQVLVAYLSGLQAAGKDLNLGIKLPMMLKPQLSELLRAAVLADENRPGGDPYELHGVWHRAVNRLIWDARKTCRAMTAHYEYPQSLPLGDGAHRSVMAAIRDMRIELPTAEEMASADKARKDAKVLATLKNRTTATAAAATAEWDDGAEVYSYD